MLPQRHEIRRKCLGAAIVSIVACCSTAPSSRADQPAPVLVPQVGHVGHIKDIVGSADGHWLVSAGGWDRTVHIRHRRTLELHRVLQSPRLPFLSVIAVSDDGTRVAAAGLSPDIVVWDRQTGRVMQTLHEEIPPEHGEAAAKIAISPDGKTLASIRFGRPVHFWRLNDGELIRTFSIGRNYIHDLSFSPGGRTLAISGGTGTTLWDVASGELQRTLSNKDGDAAGGATRHVWSPDGTQLVQVSGRRVWDGGADATRGGVAEITLWDTERGDLQHLMSWPSTVSDVAWSPDGEYIAVTGSHAAVWRVRDWRIVEMPVFRPDFRGIDERDPVDASIVAFLPAIPTNEPIGSRPETDGSSEQTGQRIELVFGCNDASLRVKPVESETRFRKVQERYFSMLSPRRLDGNRVVVYGDAGRYTIWDLSTGMLAGAGKSGKRLGDLLAVSPDGEQVVSRSQLGQRDHFGRRDEKIEWRKEFSVRPLCDAEWYWHAGAAFSPDGQHLIVSTGKSIGRWRIDQSGPQRVVMRSHAGGRAPLALSADGRLLAACQFDVEPAGRRSRIRPGGGVALIDTESGETHFQLKLEGVATAVFLSPDAELLATGERDGQTQIWQTVTGKKLHSLSHEGHELNVPLAWSPDGVHLLTGRQKPESRSSYGLTLWDMTTSEVVWSTRQFLSRNAVFSENGRTIAIEDADRGTLNVISAVDGTLLTSTRMFEENGNSNPVWITYTPDGEYVSGTHGERIIRWRLGERLLQNADWNERFNQPKVIRKRLETGAP